MSYTGETAFLTGRKHTHHTMHFHFNANAKYRWRQWDRSCSDNHAGWQRVRTRAPNQSLPLPNQHLLIHNRIKVYIADRDLKTAQAVASELNNKNEGSKQSVCAVEADVADWDSQRRAFQAAVAEFTRIDYVFPIAGIGERRSFPNRPNTTEEDGYEKPDLSVLDVDGVGVIYTVSLALQHFRRQQPNKYGFRGKSMSISYPFAVGNVFARRCQSNTNLNDLHKKKRNTDTSPTKS